jgi:hypothetical protein
MENALATLMTRTKLITGWVGVALSTMLVGFWAFWGILETLQEGTWLRQWGLDSGMMAGQRFVPAAGFVIAGITGILWPRAGGALHWMLALAAAILLRGASATILLIALPLAVLGALYWFGRVEPRRWALMLVAGVPFVITVPLRGITEAVGLK